MEKRVLTVLRSGGEYGPQHVQAIQRQLKQWAPDAALTCLSDVDVPGVDTIPLHHSFPGWWAKLELFRPGLPADFLYTDLDNVILGPLDYSFWARGFTADVGFSFFRMTVEVDRLRVFCEFNSNAQAHMAEWSRKARTDGKFGDAAFLRWRCGLTPAEWPKPQVTNVVEICPPCPWRVPPVVLRPDIKVLLLGGERWRPWAHTSQTLREAYWCR